MMTEAGGDDEGRVIVDSAELSTRVSTWTEHLCLQRLSDGKWQIDIRSWEVAGEAKDYYDKEAEETILPDQIDGVDWAEFRELFPKEWRSVKTWRKIEAALSAYPR